MAKPRNGVLAALDVGSSKIACLVAVPRPGGGLRISGIGTNRSRGVKSGAIVNMEAAETAILESIGAAEEMAGERLHSLFVSVSAGEPASLVQTTEVEIDGDEVGDADLRRIHSQDGAHFDVGDGRELIHYIPTGYRIDGLNGIENPLGLAGRRLGVEIHMVSIETGIVRNLVSCVSRCHLDVENIVIEPYASGLSCLDSDEMALGATVVDMGAGTTSIGVFQDGELIHADMVPLGGDHISRDIAIGLETSLVCADRLKMLHAIALPSSSFDMDLIDVPLSGEENLQSLNRVPRSDLIAIVKPRQEEILELVRDRLAAGSAVHPSVLRVVLTGGASQLAGVPELAALIFDKRVRLGQPRRFSGMAEAASGPAFSAVAGLLKIAAVQQNEHKALGHPGSETGGKPGFLRQWLRDSVL